MEKPTTFGYRCLCGLLIGIGFILPGVSGGVMAVSMGLYRPMLDAVTGLVRAPSASLRLLAPIGLGGAAGTLLGARALSLLMARWEKPLLFLFIGFILGGVPGMLREADREGFRRKHLWALLPGLALTLPFLLLGGAETRPERLSLAQALATGGVYALGTVIPGLSASFLLLRLGWYPAALVAVGSVDAGVIAPMALGFAAVALATLRGVKWLFDHAGGYAGYGALGFALVSVGLVFPGAEGGVRGWAEWMLLATGAVIAGRMGKGKG